MKLSKKIILSLTASTLMTLIMGGVIYSNTTKMIDAQKWVSHTNQVVAEFKQILSLMIDMETGSRGYLMSGDEKFLEPLNNAKAIFEPQVKKLQMKVADNSAQVKRLDDILGLYNNWVSGPLSEDMSFRKKLSNGEVTLKAFEDQLKLAKGKVIMDGFRGLIADAVQMEEVLNVERSALSESLGSRTVILVLVGLPLATFIGFGLCWVTISRTSKQLGEISKSISVASNEIIAIAKQTSSASQSLSSSSTEQASGLQETAASLEEINSMVQKSLDSTELSLEASLKSQNSAVQGNHVVDELINSIGRISNSNNSLNEQMEHNNREMSKIIKIIDDISQQTQVINDIVFQTKLLSFNASVEAARAGEHGKGFSVVAEEVGNLASMSGTAAEGIKSLLAQSAQNVQDVIKQTQMQVSNLLETSSQTISEGVQKANQCKLVLDQISNNLNSSTELSRQITQASNEQAKGIEQINIAVQQIDVSTQNNSKIATEAEALSSNLSSQAEQLQLIIKGLEELVHGEASRES